MNLIASKGLRVKFNDVQGVFILDTIKIGKIVPLDIIKSAQNRRANLNIPSRHHGGVRIINVIAPCMACVL